MRTEFGHRLVVDYYKQKHKDKIKVKINISKMHIEISACDPLKIGIYNTLVLKGYSIIAQVIIEMRVL